MKKKDFSWSDEWAKREDYTRQFMRLDPTVIGFTLDDDDSRKYTNFRYYSAVNYTLEIMVRPLRMMLDCWNPNGAVPCRGVRNQEEFIHIMAKANVPGAVQYLRSKKITKLIHEN